MFSCVDTAWRAHLATLDELYEDVITRIAISVGALEDMVAEFRVEARAAYRTMWHRMRVDSVRFFFSLRIESAK